MASEEIFNSCDPSNKNPRHKGMAGGYATQEKVTNYRTMPNLKASLWLSMIALSSSKPIGNA